MIVVCMVCYRVANIHREPVDDLSTTHGLCARCNVESEQLRGKSIERLKHDADTINDLKHHIRDEIEKNITWNPPENDKDWKEKQFTSEGDRFYSELVGEVKNELNVGLKR
jgi:hypothetical protein